MKLTVFILLLLATLPLVASAEVTQDDLDKGAQRTATYPFDAQMQKMGEDVPGIRVFSYRERSALYYHLGASLPEYYEDKELGSNGGYDYA